MLNTKEHYDLIEHFERACKSFPRRFRMDKEPKEMWPRGRIYQQAELNEHFLAFRSGYALGRVIERDETT